MNNNSWTLQNCWFILIHHYFAALWQVTCPSGPAISAVHLVSLRRMLYGALDCRPLGSPCCYYCAYDLCVLFVEIINSIVVRTVCIITWYIIITFIVDTMIVYKCMHLFEQTRDPRCLQLKKRQSYNHYSKRGKHSFGIIRKGQTLKFLTTSQQVQHEVTTWSI